MKKNAVLALVIAGMAALSGCAGFGTYSKTPDREMSSKRNVAKLVYTEDPNNGLYLFAVDFIKVEDGYDFYRPNTAALPAGLHVLSFGYGQSDKKYITISGTTECVLNVQKGKTYTVAAYPGKKATYYGGSPARDFPWWSACIKDKDGTIVSKPCIEPDSGNWHQLVRMMSLVDTLAGEIGQSPAFEEMTEQCRIGTFHALAGDYAEAYGNFVKANNAATQLGKKCIFPAGSDTWKNFREFLAFNVDWIKDKKK